MGGIRRVKDAAGFSQETPSTQMFARPDALIERISKVENSAKSSVRELTRPEEMDHYLPIWTECFPDQDQSLDVNDHKALLRAGEKGVRFFACFDGDTAISSGYMFHQPGDPMALLCGGATRSAWRKRGAYLALIAMRAHVAKAAGVSTLCVDASPQSAPILQRLGFIANDEVIFFEKTFPENPLRV
jgi:hypothetical protein